MLTVVTPHSTDELGTPYDLNATTRGILFKFVNRNIKSIRRIWREHELLKNEIRERK